MYMYLYHIFILIDDHIQSSACTEILGERITYLGKHSSHWLKTLRQNMQLDFYTSLYINIFSDRLLVQWQITQTNSLGIIPPQRTPGL